MSVQPKKSTPLSATNATLFSQTASLRWTVHKGKHGTLFPHKTVGLTLRGHTQTHVHLKLAPWGSHNTHAKQPPAARLGRAVDAKLLQANKICGSAQSMRLGIPDRLPKCVKYDNDVPAITTTISLFSHLKLELFAAVFYLCGPKVTSFPVDFTHANTVLAIT